MGHALLDDKDAALAQHTWRLSAQGYACRGVKQDGELRVLLLHREVLGLAYGDQRQGDHIDGARLDCRRSNLRVVSRSENQQNRVNTKGRGRNTGRAATSLHRGVCWHRGAGKWTARAAGRYLGLFDDELEAARAAAAHREAAQPLANEARHVPAG